MNEKVTKEIQSYTLNKGFFIYAVKKTERLTRAIYLITNFFSENEPLRWKLRDENLALLEYFSRLSDSTGRTASVDLSLLKRSLEMSLASLGVAHTAGLISEMNFAILRNEYEGLLVALLEEGESDGSHSPLLFPKDFFAVERRKGEGESLERYLYGATFDKERTARGRALEEPRSPLGETTESDERASTPREHGALRETDKGQSKPIKDIKDSKRTPLTRSSSEQSGGSRTNRKDIILQLVKDRKEITVKDAAREIQEFSEKTLQRELVSLVNEGVLERVGSRRWSKYRFA
ncbi:MAG: hypothetical protein WDZ74_02635 [Candidatus Paceibacterota bacterium]